MDVKKVIDRFRVEKQQEEFEYKKEIDRIIEECNLKERQFDDSIRPSLNPATYREYMAWIEGYIERGGKLTHYYDYSMPSDFYIAISNFTIIPLYGAMSVNIIIPRGITVNNKTDIGHSNLYFMDGYINIGGCIPFYEG